MKILMLALSLGLFGTIGLAVADNTSSSPMGNEMSHAQDERVNNMGNMMQMKSNMASMMKQCEEMMASMKDHMKSSADS